MERGAHAVFIRHLFFFSEEPCNHRTLRPKNIRLATRYCVRITPYARRKVSYISTTFSHVSCPPSMVFDREISPTVIPHFLLHLEPDHISIHFRHRFPRCFRNCNNSASPVIRRRNSVAGIFTRGRFQRHWLSRT